MSQVISCRSTEQIEEDKNFEVLDLCKQYRNDFHHYGYTYSLKQRESLRLLQEAIEGCILKGRTLYQPYVRLERALHPD